MHRIAGLMALLIMSLAGVAHAQSDDYEFVTRYFGTQLVITTAERPYDYDTSYWTDLLPEKLLYDSSYICGLVNAGRMAAGDMLLLDPNISHVETGYEEEVAEGFRYSIYFKGMRPTEIEMVLQSFGGMESMIPAASLEFEPMRSASFGFYAYEEDGLDVSVGELKLHIDLGMPATEIYDRLKAMYMETYGSGVDLDIYLGYGLSSYGNSIDLSVTVTLVDEETGTGGPQF